MAADRDRQTLAILSGFKVRYRDRSRIDADALSKERSAAMINIIDLGLMFVLLPFMILSDSWKRLRRIGWDWFIFGFFAMSLFATLMQDIVFPLWFGEKNLFNILLTRGIILAGVLMFFGIYATVEQPILRQGRKWRVFRAIAAAFIAVVLLVVISQTIKAGSLTPASPRIYGWLLVAGAIAFVATQVGTYMCRDQEKITAHRKNQEEEQKKQQPPAPAKSATTPLVAANEQLRSCPNCGMKFRSSDYDRNTEVWHCSGCKSPLPHD